MQGIDTVVGSQGIFFTIERETGFRNTVTITANQSAEIGIAFLLKPFQVSETKNHIPHLAFVIRRDEFTDRSAIVNDANLHTGCVGKCIFRYRLTLECAEWHFTNTRLGV